MPGTLTAHSKATVEPRERTLSFDAPGLCKVVARATKEHYEDWEREHAIRVRPGVITAGTIPDFVSNRTLLVGGSNRRPDGTYSLNPSDAVSSWQLVRGERDCELVNPVNGTVRALAQGYARSENPVCSIQVVARKENYRSVQKCCEGDPLGEGCDGCFERPGLW